MSIKLVLIGLFLVMVSFVKAQTAVVYEYDYNGNRTERFLYVFKKATPIDSIVGDSTIKEAFIPIEEKDTQIMQNMTISVYPNPVEYSLFVEVINQNNPLTYSLYDIQGHQVFSKELINQKTPVDFKSLSPGYYMFYISSGEEKLVWKIVKK